MDSANPRSSRFVYIFSRGHQSNVLRACPFNIAILPPALSENFHLHRSATLPSGGRGIHSPHRDRLSNPFCRSSSLSISYSHLRGRLATQQPVFRTTHRLDKRYLNNLC